MNSRLLHPSPQISSLHGMVASAHPLASRAGISTLERGGNAFDAAVAVAATLNVVEPFMSGLAGMGYAVLWAADEKRIRVLDFVPPVPNSFAADRFTSRVELARGAHSIGLPGNLAGWSALSRQYGKMRFADLLRPAIRVARDGFALAEFGAHEFSETAPELMTCAGIGPGWQSSYPFAADAGIGQIVRQPDLAETYRTISEEGVESLYGGVLGERVVHHIQALGGTLTLEDLRGVRVEWHEPLSVEYRGRLIHVPPPPCEGFQFLLTLKILEEVDFRSFDRNSPDHLDIVIRAIRLAAGVRIACNRPSVDDLAAIFSDEHLAALRGKLSIGEGRSGQTEQWSPDAFKEADPAHTTSFSIADSNGNLICVTQSLGSVFGSGIVVPGCGICLNNLLYWADVQPQSPNRTIPGSTFPVCMAPSLSTSDDEPVLALGTPGGYGILQTQAQAMVQLLDYGLPLRESIGAPRMRLWDGAVVEVENRVAPETISALRSKGHDVTVLDSGWTMIVGGMQAVSRDPTTGLLIGAADPRRDGVAMPL